MCVSQVSPQQQKLTSTPLLHMGKSQKREDILAQNLGQVSGKHPVYADCQGARETPITSITNSNKNIYDGALLVLRKQCCALVTKHQFGLTLNDF